MANIEVLLPDIGDYSEVDVIDIAVKAGDQIQCEDPLLTLETDKATMDIPSPCAGKVVEVKVNIGDKVSKDHLVLILSNEQASAPSKQTEAASEPEQSSKAPVEEIQEAPKAASNTEVKAAEPYAGPSVRRLARELEIDLNLIKGTGEKNRITKLDLRNHLSSTGSGSASAALPKIPEQDFSKFGEVEIVNASRIKKISAANLHRNWVNIPHVTHCDEADITELEKFRNEHKDKIKEKGGRLTPLCFFIKAVVKALQEYPQFNASLANNGESVVLKKYFNIGIAVDTPNGLVVPVLKNVDQKSITDLAIEIASVSKKAREGKLTGADMQGGCFTISSLGGIGGTSFTPIVNAPEVAILGIVRSYYKPVYINNEFVPRLVTPLALSYDHRQIDGAEAARFMKLLTEVLSDLRNLIM